MNNPNTNFIWSNNLPVFHFIKCKLPLPHFAMSIFSLCLETINTYSIKLHS